MAVMTVADMIARLAELPPDMVCVTPQAPYGQPTTIPEDYINVIDVDSEAFMEGDGEAGQYVGIGFPPDKAQAFCDTDDIPEDIVVEPEPEPWHDTFVPKTAEEIKKIIDEDSN